jgi:sugar-specific transcriptional regulator TrmB
MLTSAIDKLVALGLCEYEARAYVVLLEESPSTGNRIADCSGVPRSQIQHVLESLEIRGAVVSTNGDGPRTFTANCADDFLNKVRREYRNQIASFRASLTGGQL